MNDLIQSALVDLLKKQIVNAIIAKIPFLGGGFLAPIVGYFVGKLAKFIITQTALGIQIVNSRIEVNKQVKAIEDAVADGQQGDLTDEQKQEILKRIRDASDSLIKF